jgi:hypothetical protein
MKKGRGRGRKTRWEREREREKRWAEERIRKTRWERERESRDGRKNGVGSEGRGRGGRTCTPLMLRLERLTEFFELYPPRKIGDN